ncbi:MAG: hypothetical protein ACKOAD_06575 [Gammaproteobacteria bacterium]
MKINFKTQIAPFMLLVFLISSMPAHAADNLASIINSYIKANVESVGQLITLLSYVAGIALAITGILQFKAHKDNAIQNPLSKPITVLCIAGALLFMPKVVEIAGQSLFGADKEWFARKTDKLFKD